MVFQYGLENYVLITIFALAVAGIVAAIARTARR